MSTEQEKKLLHHYQCVDAAGVVYTVDLSRKSVDGLITYEIKSASQRERPELIGSRYESDSYTEDFADEASANAKFIELLGMHVK